MNRVEYLSLCVDLILDAGSWRTCGSVGSRRWPGASLHVDSGEDLGEGESEAGERQETRHRDGTSANPDRGAVGRRRTRPRRMGRASEGDGDERNPERRQYRLCFVGPSPSTDISHLSLARIRHTFTSRPADRICHLRAIRCS